MNPTLMIGTIRNGRVETDEPINLPDGTALLISVQNGKPDDVEDGWDNSPEGIADWLAWCDSLQPLKITAQEQAEVDAWLKKMNDHEAANVAATIKDVFQ